MSDSSASSRPQSWKVDKDLKMPTAPQSKISESPLFRELRKSVAKETVAFTFACGGTIPMFSRVDDATNERDDDGEDPHRTPCLPIDLRWDSQEKGLLASQAKVTFPLEPGTDENLAQLIKDMSPASFGRGSEEVYDEAYRKATKLDPTCFSSTFNPYTLGIVDTISQALLPSLRQRKHTRSVRAELYKLNLYSGPSGKFKPHLDTPRSPDQFGSLVVCLPLQHRGGALEVRHKGNTVSFDWSHSTGDSEHPSLGWAAFYSDCEHEVLEVTEGHRLTLAYNLFCVRGNGQLAGNCPWLDPTHLPLYKTILALVQDQEGWAEGGYLGFNCSHAYPHTTNTNLIFLAPDNLKGADMLMYEIFRALNLNIMFRPVVKKLLYYDDNDEEARPVVGQHLEWEQWYGYIEEYEEAYDGWTGKVPDDPEQDETEPRKYIPFDDVDWLNDTGHQEKQISWMAYGNEPDAMNTYSSCAIIAEISPRASQEAETDGTASGAEDVDEAESSAVLEESRVDLTTATQ